MPHKLRLALGCLIAAVVIPSLLLAVLYVSSGGRKLELSNVAVHVSDPNERPVAGAAVDVEWPAAAYLRVEGEVLQRRARSAERVTDAYGNAFAAPPPTARRGWEVPGALRVYVYKAGYRRSLTVVPPERGPTAGVGVTLQSLSSNEQIGADLGSSLCHDFDSLSYISLVPGNAPLYVAEMRRAFTALPANLRAAVSQKCHRASDLLLASDLKF